jgi:hypothetical protein
MIHNLHTQQWHKWQNWDISMQPHFGADCIICLELLLIFSIEQLREYGVYPQVLCHVSCHATIAKPAEAGGICIILL